MNSKKICLDQNGYNSLLENIEDLKARLREVNFGRREAFDAGSGDGWDTPEFEEIERQERVLLGELKRCYEQLANVEIIERQADSDIIDIGDVVKLTIFFGVGESDDELFKLVGGYPNLKSPIQEVSINSPIGMAIYQKKVGEHSSYEVEGRQFKVLIVEKLDLSKSPEEQPPMR